MLGALDKCYPTASFPPQIYNHDAGILMPFLAMFNGTALGKTGGREESPVLLTLGHYDVHHTSGSKVLPWSHEDNEFLGVDVQPIILAGTQPASTCRAETVCWVLCWA